MKKELIRKLIMMPLLLMSHWNLGWGQSAQQYLEKVAAYYKATPMKFSVNYEVFANTSLANPIQRLTMDYRMKGDLIGYDFAEVSVFINEKFSLSIDHAEKRMVLNKVNPKFEKKYKQAMMSLNMDSIFAKYTTVSIVKETDSIVRLKVTYLGGGKEQMESTEMTIDKGFYRILTLSMQYNQTFKSIYGQVPKGVSSLAKPKLVLTFEHYKGLDAADLQPLFYASEMLKIDSKGNAVVTEKYKSYTIANYYKLK